MINEEEKTNYFKGLKKVDPNRFDNNRSLPYGYITNIHGNIYRIPISGYSDFYISDNGNGKYRLRYDFSKQGIEIYLKDDENWKYGTLIDIRVEEWFDDPEYWIEEISKNPHYYSLYHSKGECYGRI